MMDLSTSLDSNVLNSWCEEIWLSTQFIDHMLLTLTGFPYAIVQPMLACIHIELRDNGIDTFQSSAPQLHAAPEVRGR